MTVTIKKVENIVSLVEKGNESHIIKTWYADDFTTRKRKGNKTSYGNYFTVG